MHGADVWNGANEFLHVLVRTLPVRIQVRLNVGGGLGTGWLEPPRADAYHVELELSAASAPGAADASLRVWLDGVEAAKIDGLADEGNRVETVRFGAMQVGPNRAGRLYLDNFQLWVPHVPELASTIALKETDP